MNPRELAQDGLDQIKNAILAYLATRPEGLSNAEIAEALAIRSDYEGENRDFLCWSILGLLVNDQKVKYIREGNRKKYFIA